MSFCGRLALLILFILNLSEWLPASENIIIIIIDGARYSETFGDPDYSNIPQMQNMSAQGTVIDYFYNDSITYTSRAIPALWCGSWTEVNDIYYNSSNTKHAVKPTIFEYYRKSHNKNAEDCFYTIKELSGLWLASFDPDYGPDYWPTYHSSGHTDSEVATETQWIMDYYHPPFLLMYLADVDSYGHSGNRESYTTAIQKADSITGLIWQKAQSDPFYKDKTTFFVTNDHGRHDEEHGGFSGHGCDCDGCRHIMFLALGPEIKSGFHSSVPRRIPDMTVTAGHLLNFDTPQATGEVMTEILKPTTVRSQEISASDYSLSQNYPNPFNLSTTIKYQVPLLGGARGGYHLVKLEIFNILGQKVSTLVSEKQKAGRYEVEWDASGYGSGVYFYRLSTDKGYVQTKKLILLK